MPPANINFIGSESLGDPWVFDLGLFCCGEVLQEPSVGNHGSIVDGISLVDGAHGSASLLDHLFDHFLEPDITADSADYNDFFGFAMAHGPLSNFDKHCEDGLLEWEA